MNRATKRWAGLAVAAGVLCILSLGACKPADAPPHAATAATGAAPAAGGTPVGTPGPTTREVLPAGFTSVRVFIKMIISKQYGVVAKVAGNPNTVDRRMEYVAANPWWVNPLVVYDEMHRIPDPDLSAGSDSEEIIGQGKSSNVTVDLTLVPHADIAIKTMPKCEGMKGTITATIASISEYYDGQWVEMSRMDKPLVFNFDTCDPKQTLIPIGVETRTVPDFAFERYTREKEKWEPRTAWPGKPESGDWRITVNGKSAKLQFTAYRYGKPAAAK